MDNTDDEDIKIDVEFKGIVVNGFPEFNSITKEHHHDLLKELNESNALFITIIFLLF